MSRISTEAKRMSNNQKLKPDEIVKNFMGGDSYKLNPLDTLRMIAASSIFGEPSYYRSNIKDTTFVSEERIITDELFVDTNNKTTTEIFTEAIDNALDYDFGATLELAVELRNEYWMRLNPQVIAVRAAIHPKRKEWSVDHPGEFNRYQASIMKRADEPATQCAYYLYINKGKKGNMPSILKRSIADKLSHLGRYQVNKYKNAEIGMINAVRLTHANSPVLNELMKTGTVYVKGEDETWEQMRSRGCSWKEIIEKIDMGHMALLRNIRNVFTEVDDIDLCKSYMKILKEGVPTGKQFPFRYESAYKQIEVSSVNHKAFILDSLEECIDISVNNLPKLPGKTVCLTDNSLSAWKAMTSEYGSTTIANINNLSSVIATQCSEDEGTVVEFGDRYIEYPISKRNGVLLQTKNIDADKGIKVGGSTEGGIWKFFKHIIDNKIVYDNIFMFSDMQAGTGGLYGTESDFREYHKDFGFSYGFVPNWRWKGRRVDIYNHINVYKLILEYRKKVNPKVNVFSIQTAGYDNVLIPQMSYRCAMLTGWTGKEISFAYEYIKQWDNIEKEKNKNKESINTSTSIHN